MRSVGISDADIPEFQDPKKWLYYFPPLAVEDLKAFGLGCDWRRSFITTEMNPYFDSFVRWQMKKLKSMGEACQGRTSGTTYSLPWIAAAALRPETMYGQTNAWVLPHGDYGTYEVNESEDEVSIMTHRAALNLACQSHSRGPSQTHLLERPQRS